MKIEQVHAKPPEKLLHPPHFELYPAQKVNVIIELVTIRAMPTVFLKIDGGKACSKKARLLEHSVLRILRKTIIGLVKVASN